MPGSYTGAALGITSSTNATPIAIVATAHGRTTGDVVSIAGHLVNTKANGEWTITVTGANGFTLNSSVGNGVGGATGTVTAFVPIITIPSDGDGPIQAADVNVPFEGLADRVQMLYRAFKSYLLGIFPIVPARAITRVQSGTPDYRVTEWSRVQGAWQSVAATGALIRFPVELPHGSVWTTYTVAIQPGAHGALPAVVYSCAPLRQNFTTGAITTPAGFTASISDPAVNTTQYDAYHGIGDSAGTEVVDRENYRYFVEVAGESGANSVAVTSLFPVLTTVNVNALDVGAS